MSFLSGLLRFRSRPPAIACQAVVELVTDYLEGALPAAEHRRLAAHFADCPHCTEYLAQIRETIRLTGRVTPEDMSPAMRADLTELYRRWQAGG